MQISKEFINQVFYITSKMPEFKYFATDIYNSLSNLKDNSVVYPGKASSGTQIFLSIYAEFGCKLNHDAGKRLSCLFISKADFVITSVDKSILKMLKKNIKKNAIDRRSELEKLRYCIKEFEKDARAFETGIPNNDNKFNFGWEK